MWLHQGVDLHYAVRGACWWIEVHVLSPTDLWCSCVFSSQVPIAMVTFVDKDRVWLKSVQGLPGLKQVERRVSLCAW